MRCARLNICGFRAPRRYPALRLFFLALRYAARREDGFFESVNIRRRSARLYLRFEYRGGIFGHEVVKVLPLPHAGAYERGARKGVHRFLAVVTRSLALDGERSKFGFERIYRAYIFNSECIVRRREHRCDAGIELFYGALSRRGEAHSREQVCAHTRARCSRQRRGTRL